MDIIYLIIIFGIIFLWNVILTFNHFKIISKNKELFNKKNKGDIYSTINSYLVKIREIEAQNNRIIDGLEKIDADYSNCLQKVGMIRYNPFGDIGGDQSFSIAFLDKHDNGIVMTSIHGREGNRLYSKPIKNGKSEYNLSKEEELAIGLADKNFKREERRKNV